MRSLREAAGLTQVQVAELRGVTQPTVAEAEKAGAAVSVGKLVEAARAVGMALEIRIKPAPGAAGRAPAGDPCPR
jgi:transcriptional regulator with XRE-family HTH domain